ncbi:hypothetical protein Goari_027133 [Gossypium aridum]|uniref:Uncharacterized protein n=1 Tax=Gossypium aridum TaxID=34290 RepID=A0A7J8YTB7_GOSAI|nr:hypothetical protein [Gossypium aridum]
MVVGVETKEMGWDLSIRAQSRRAQMMTSVWLQEESEGQGRGIYGERQTRGRMSGVQWKVGAIGKFLIQFWNSLMEHDFEDEVIVGEEGKKRNRREMEDALAKEETNLAERSRRVVEVSHQLSAAAKWQADR